METRRILMTAAVKQAIESHALAASPSECCGLLSGKNEIITCLHPLRNDAPNAESRYYAAPEDLFSAMRRIRESDEMLFGIYHSHPRTPAYPSAADVDMAFYPEAVYFIISLEPGVDMRAYRIDGSSIEGVSIEITNEGGP